MDIVSVKMLGNPIVKFNNNKISFPYKKAEALFYYVCVNKRVPREEAINMFWTDSDETTGRKNLRDAIYKIKTNVCDTIFASSKSVIEFSDEILVETDIDNITILNARNIYIGDFLLNFSVKNCRDFENWMLEKRNYYKDIYIKSIYDKVNELVSVGDFISIQKYSNILTQNDPYNEKTYRYLMKIFALSGNYNMSIKLYYELTKILKQDLEIEPEQRTKKMFKEILELKNTFNYDQQNSNYINLKNKVENLTDYYTIYHETYPILSSETIKTCNSTEIYNVEAELLNIEKDLNNLDDLDTDYIKIKMEASYLAGRYYISIGKYEQGINNIYISIKFANKLDNIMYLLNNYKQMIFYAIQVDNNEIMNDYIVKSLQLLDKKDIIEERGIILRLKGLYYIKTENYKQATNVLMESIKIFSSLNNFNSKYSINISACYNYLGQMNKDLENYEIAYDYFIKAINICLDNSMFKGMEIFYSNAGQTLYNMGRYAEAESFINKSIEYFDKYNVIWGRDFAECHKALIEIEKENYANAKIHCEKAYELAKKLNNPKSLSLTEEIKKKLEAF
ncbi:MAG: BTAD domain-containing putative transcriptional regulator [Sedimentibacter sp.]|uniref:BTAD domain-containing putative transcriptional regulator n=1 Tax=Sedimentibacter sp. TaxID=1960295 RepID=UPI002980BAAB|nr:BTAD domain-containing putative transcriptional regulator [Sedimentibacter sp.]MDW5299276.1 BTAD domain-containing putative transcriptional regulator [Sedimentibacter sp.]